MIVTLALRNLAHDKVRLLATLFGVAFSVILMIGQSAIYAGASKTITTILPKADVTLAASKVICGPQADVEGGAPAPIWRSPCESTGQPLAHPSQLASLDLLHRGLALEVETNVHIRKGARLRASGCL